MPPSAAAAAPVDIANHALVKYLLARAKPGVTKVSVNASLWGEEVAAEAEGGRFTGFFKRWIHKRELRIKVAWEDGEGVHGLEEMIEHGLAVEGAQGAARQGSVEEGEGDESNPSDSSVSEGEGEEEPSSTADSSGVIWTRLDQEITVDSRTSGDFGPRFGASHGDFTNPTKLFLYLLPHALKDGACVFTNATIAADNDKVDLSELLLFYAYLILIAVHDTAPVADMWSKTSTFCGAPDIGRHGMSKNRFFYLWSHWRCGPDALPGGDDPWARVRSLIDGFNAHMAVVLVPGYLLVVDESMCAWRGLGLPHLSFVPRKPEPLGVENKTAACALSKMIVSIEPAEGKERMKLKKFEDKYGHTTATTLRLVEKYAVVPGTNQPVRVVAGDSWFASVTTALAVKKELGLDFLGIVKTAHKYYPRDDVARVGQAKGSWVTYTATVDGVRLIALGHRKGQDKVNQLIATSGITAKGERMWYAYSEGQLHNRQKYWISWDAPVVANVWTKAQPGIDANNRVRQHDLALEKRFGTHDPFIRYQTHVLGVVLANAIEGWCNIINQGRRDSPRELAREIGMGLLAHLRAEKAVPLSLSGSLALSQGTTGGGSSIRDSPGKHMPLSYCRAAGKSSGYQRHCVVCGKDTSFFCSMCGDQVAVHPARVQGRAAPVDCIDRHRRDPAFRFRREPRPARAPTSDRVSGLDQQPPAARRRLN